eukprot:15257689-Heterocapsa_arctica.AAC.1
MPSNTKRLRAPPRERKADKLSNLNKWDMKRRPLVTSGSLGVTENGRFQSTEEGKAAPGWHKPPPVF